MRRHPERFGLEKISAKARISSGYQSSAADLRQEEILKYSQLQTAGEIRARCPFAKIIERYLEDALTEDEFLAFVEKLHSNYFVGRPLVDLTLNIPLLDHIFSIMNQARHPGVPQCETPAWSADILSALIFRYFQDRIVTKYDAREITELRQRMMVKGYPVSSLRCAELIDAHMCHILHAQLFAKHMNERIAQQHFNVEQEKESYLELADEIFVGLKQLRRYSIVPSMYEDGLSHGENQGWIAMDPCVFRRMNNPIITKTFKHAVAVFLFTSESRDVKNISVQGRRDTRSRVQFERLDFSFPYDFRWTLADDGEIYLCTHPIKQSLRGIYKQMKCEGMYEFVRFLFIAHVFDLVVPIEVSEQAPSLHGLRETIRQKQQESGESPDAIIRKLVLPRKLIVRDTEKLQKAIDDSSEESHAEVERRLGRKIEHRIGSPVRLREGYRRHPQAVEWAAEYGVTLKDNETWRQPVDPEKPLQKIVYSSKKDIMKDLPSVSDDMLGGISSHRKIGGIP